MAELVAPSSLRPVVAAVTREQDGMIILHVEYAGGYVALSMTPNMAHKVAGSLSLSLTTHHQKMAAR